ncbi:MAG: orotate phosphoribosyltransferase [Deltaproteobacteria bacterium]|nr:orotate phosphoribosyltransferase [Deltaproteobacteria bacterium]
MEAEGHPPPVPTSPSGPAFAWPGAPPPGGPHYLERLLELLRTQAFERREVVLASGRRSNFYLDCRRVVLSAEGHFLVGWLFHHLITRLDPEAVAVGGMSLGADPLASATSLMSHLAGRPLDAFYVRKKAKGHGTGKVIEGATRLGPGTPVVVVEDVVTSGGSSLLAVQRCREAGLRPVRVLALVDRCEGGREAIEAELPLTTLLVRGDFPA